jgi:raffinose/stachyose/melibiose transport system substrate-binding protein
MMNKKYWVIIIIVFVLLAVSLLLVLSKYQQEENTNSLGETSNTTTLHFTSSWAGYDANAIPLQTVLQKYEEKNNSVEIVNESMVGEDFLFTLKTDFASGNEPDVFGLWPGSDFDILVEQEKVADLTELMNEHPEWYDRFREDTWKYVTVNDRIYGLPFEIIYEGLFVNKDMFEKYNVAIPRTYEELLLAVEVFNANNVIPIAYNSTPEGSYIYQNIVMKLGGKSEVEEPFNALGNLKPSFLEGLYVMKELYDAGAFPDQAFLIDDKTRNDLFIQKEAAMIVQGSWLIGEEGIDANDTSIDIVPFPSFKNGKAHDSAIIYGCGNGIFHISQKAWEDDELRAHAITLLDELTSVESALTFSESGGFISNVEIPQEQMNPSTIYVKGEELIHNAKELVGPTDSFIDRNLWEDILIEQFPDILEGNISPEFVLKRIEDKMKGTQ